MKARDLQLGVLYAYAPGSKSDMVHGYGVQPALVVDVRPVARKARYSGRGAGSHVQVALQYTPGEVSQWWDDDQQAWRTITTEAEARKAAADLNADAFPGQLWVPEQVPAHTYSGPPRLHWQVRATRPQWTPRTVPLAHLRWLWADVEAARAEWEAEQARLRTLRLAREAEQAVERAEAARQQRLADSVRQLVKLTHQQRADHLARLIGPPGATGEAHVSYLGGSAVRWRYSVTCTPEQYAALASEAPMV